MASVLALSIAAALMLRSGGSRPATRWDAAALLAFAPVTVAFGLLFSRAPYPLTISERSILVDVHVAFAWAAYALLLRACVTATRTLLGIHADGDADDRVMLRATGLGFTMFTGLMIVGAVYSFQLFTRFFSWEVVETLSVAAWLAYSVVLHQRLFFGWRGRRFAWLVLATLPLLLAAYWTWSVFAGTYHFFEITEIHA
jgi:ABC-type transport system involved in cytochrome c biogenesis permease subunit